MQHLGHAYSKNLPFTQNSNRTEHPAFYLGTLHAIHPERGFLSNHPPQRWQLIGLEFIPTTNFKARYAAKLVHCIMR